MTVCPENELENFSSKLKASRGFSFGSQRNGIGHYDTNEHLPCEGSAVSITEAVKSPWDARLHIYFSYKNHQRTVEMKRSGNEYSFYLLNLCFMDVPARHASQTLTLNEAIFAAVGLSTWCLQHLHLCCVRVWILLAISSVSGYLWTALPFNSHSHLHFWPTYSERFRRVYECQECGGEPQDSPTYSSPLQLPTACQILINEKVTRSYSFLVLSVPLWRILK